MSFETLVGLQVSDDAAYTQYRELMKPLLEKFEGGFRYDFKVAEVLKNEEGKPINRVFIIHFPDQSKKEAFFNNPEYKKVKEQFFDRSVTSRTLIAEYQR